MFCFVYKKRENDNEGEWPSAALRREVHEWCTDQFGPEDFTETRVGRWMLSQFGSHIWFRSETDATVFRLRFG